MKKLIVTSLLAATMGAHAAQPAAQAPLTPKANGQAVVINGKTYHKQAAPQARSARSLALGSEAATLYRGNVVQSSADPLPAAASGGVLVQLANAQDEAAVAQAYGLSVRFRTSNVVLFQAAASTELLALVKKLQGDKRVKQVQLELVNNEAQAQ